VSESEIERPGKVPGTLRRGAARRRGARVDLRGLATLAALILIWEIWQRLPGQSSALTTSFVDVALTGVRLALNGTLWRDCIATLVRVLIGFTLGTAAGLMLGALLGISGWADRILGPIFTALRQIPIFGLIPLISIWFGTAEGGKLVLIGLAAFYPVLLHTHEGLRSAAPSYHDVATVFMFSRGQILRRVRLPCALQSILTGVKHAVAFSWISGVGSELFMSSDSGIGNLLTTGRIELRMDYVWLGIIIVGATGYAMNRCFEALERRLLHWRPRYGG
jgi:sulfonate transport system permease protein